MPALARNTWLKHIALFLFTLLNLGCRNLAVGSCRGKSLCRCRYSISGLGILHGRTLISL